MKINPLSLTVVAALCLINPSFATDKQTPEIRMEEAIVKQIRLLERIHPILIKIVDHESAERKAAELDQLCKDYQQAKMDEDIAEEQLTERQADAIEDKYERQLDQIEDKVEDLAEKLYERKKGYGSDALMRAIYPIAD